MDKVLPIGTENFLGACLSLGNGDFHKGTRILYDIAIRLKHARSKHPKFVKSKGHACAALKDEVREFSQAINYESENRQKDEILDVIAVAIRFYGDEHKDGKNVEI